MFPLLLSMTVIFVPALASAQMMNSMWGSGMWGAQQSCMTPMRMGQGSTSLNDGANEAKREMGELERKLRAKKTQLKNIEKELDRARKDVEDNIDSDYADALFEHIEARRTCDEYKGLGDPDRPQKCPPDADGGCSQGTGLVPPPTVYKNDWANVCSANRMGGVNGHYACTLPRSRTGGGRSGSTSDCEHGLSTYGKKYAEKSKLEREVRKLEDAVARAKDDIQSEKESRRAEGGVCIECMIAQNGSGSGGGMNRGTDWAGVLTNLTMGLAGTYMGYQQNKMTTQANSALGFPTQQMYPSWSYGFPYLASGLYGAIGGATGQGSFGCGNSMGMPGTGMGMSGMGMNQGSAFGYPYNAMMNPTSGGMYLPGSTPWGMNGPNSMMMNPMNGVTMGTVVPGSNNGYGSMGYGSMTMGTMVPGYGSYNGLTNYGLNGYGLTNGSYGYVMPGSSTAYSGTYSPYAYQNYYSQAQQSQIQMLMYRLQNMSYGSSYYGLGGYYSGSSLGSR